MSHRYALTIATIALLTAADRVEAQAFSHTNGNVRIGVGVGYGFYPGYPGYGYGFGPSVGLGYGYGPRVSPYYGPGLWGWGGPYGYGFGYGWLPGAAGSFYTNGRSLYGPPVPTPGPIPGSFSPNAGYPANVYSPGGIYGFGSTGAYGASKDLPLIVPPADYAGPRFATRDVKKHYAAMKADPGAAIDRAFRDQERFDYRLYGRQLPATDNAPTNRLRVLVRVPAEARVWLDDRPTVASGPERLFESPPLAAGRVYSYRVTAAWPGGSATQVASGAAGEVAEVVFGGR